MLTSASDIKKQSEKNKILLAMGMENKSPIENKLENLVEFYDKGIRYITLAHYKWNHISDSANDTICKWNGVSPFGEEVIKGMNHLGIIVDVSKLPNLVYELLVRGYTDEDVKKILSGNLLRVWKQVEAASNSLRQL